MTNFPSSSRPVRNRALVVLLAALLFFLGWQGRAWRRAATIRRVTAPQPVLLQGEKGTYDDSNTERFRYLLEGVDGPVLASTLSVARERAAFCVANGWYDLRESEKRDLLLTAGRIWSYVYATDGAELIVQDASGRNVGGFWGDAVQLRE